MRELGTPTAERCRDAVREHRHTGGGIIQSGVEIEKKAAGVGGRERGYIFGPSNCHVEEKEAGIKKV